MNSEQWLPVYVKQVLGECGSVGKEGRGGGDREWGRRGGEGETESGEGGEGRGTQRVWERGGGDRQCGREGKEGRGEIGDRQE